MGTGAGVFAGTSIGPLDRFGVDVVMVAFFAAVIVGKVKSSSNLISVLVAAGAAIASFGVLPTGWNIIAAALCGGIAGMFKYGK